MTIGDTGTTHIVMRDALFVPCLMDMVVDCRTLILRPSKMQDNAPGRQLDSIERFSHWTYPLLRLIQTWESGSLWETRTTLTFV